MLHEERIKDSRTKNWYKGCLGFYYLRKGLVLTVERNVNKHYKTCIENLPNISCGACSLSTLQVDHRKLKAENSCPKNRIKCLCLMPQRNRKACQNGFCDKVYERIVDDHVLSKPNWDNTDIRQWGNDYLEVAKCYITTSGYRDKKKIAEIDCSGLLSMIAHNKVFQTIRNADQNNLLWKVRDERNQLFHSSSMEMSDDQLRALVEGMIQLLRLPEILDDNGEVTLAINNLLTLTSNEIYISLDDEIAIQRDRIQELERHQEVENQRNLSLFEDIEELKTDFEEKLTRFQQKHGLTSESAKGLEKEIKTQLNDLQKSCNNIQCQETEENLQKILQMLEDLQVKQSKSDQKHEAVEKHLEDLHNEIYNIPGKIAECLRKSTKTTESLSELEKKMQLHKEKLLYLQDKKKLQNKLKEHYKECLSKVPVSPIIKSIAANVKEVLVEFCICDEVQKDVSVESLQEILYNGNTKCKRVYVVGEAGMGKTTWCKSVLSMWTDSIEEMHINTPQSDKEMQGQKPAEMDSKSQCEVLASIPTDSGTNTNTQSDDEVIYERESLRKPQSKTAHENVIPVSISDNGFKLTAKPAVAITKQYDLLTENNTLADTMTTGKNKQTDLKFSHLNDKETIRKFDLVFYVALRQHEAKTPQIHDMIKAMPLLEEYSDLQITVDTVFKNDPKSCLVLLDGLDEWPLRSEWTIPQRKNLKGCTVVTTSRPHGLVGMQSRCIDGDEHIIDRKVKITGIKDQEKLVKNVITQLDAVIKHHSKEERRIEEELKIFLEKLKCQKDRDVKARTTLPAFMQVPLMLIIMVCLWFDGEEFGDTVLKHLNSMLDYLIKHAEVYHGEIKQYISEWSKTSHFLPHWLQEKENIQQYSDLIIHVTNLAFETLFPKQQHSQLAFKKSEILKFLDPKHLEVGEIIGILTQSEVTASSLSSKTTFSFIHKYLHEYLAGVNVAIQFRKGQHTESFNAMKKLFQKPLSIKDVENTVLCIGGVDPETGHALSKHIAQETDPGALSEEEANYLNEILIRQVQVMHENNNAYPNESCTIVTNLLIFPVDLPNEKYKYFNMLLNTNIRNIKHLKVPHMMADEILGKFHENANARDLCITISDIQPSFQLAHIKPTSFKTLVLMVNAQKNKERQDSDKKGIDKERQDSDGKGIDKERQDSDKKGIDKERQDSDKKGIDQERDNTDGKGINEERQDSDGKGIKKGKIQT